MSAMQLAGCYADEAVAIAAVGFVAAVAAAAVLAAAIGLVFVMPAELAVAAEAAEKRKTMDLLAAVPIDLELYSKSGQPAAPRRVEPVH